jgi:hypothetical protein
VLSISFQIQIDGFDPKIFDSDLTAFGDLAAQLQNIGNADMSLGIFNGVVSVDVWRDDCETLSEAMKVTITELETIGLTGKPAKCCR